MATLKGNRLLPARIINGVKPGKILTSVGTLGRRGSAVTAPQIDRGTQTSVEVGVCEHNISRVFPRMDEQPSTYPIPPLLSLLSKDERLSKPCPIHAHNIRLRCPTAAHGFQSTIPTVFGTSLP